MDCREYRRLASLEADGLLDAEGRAGLDRHVASCGACLRFRDAVLAGASIHRDAADVAPPAGLASKIMAAANAPESVRFPAWMRVAVPAAAAAAVLGIWLGGLLIDRLVPSNTQNQADVLELQYLNEYPPGSVGEILVASNAGGSDERK